MPTPNSHRRLAAIMFTDIVGYTALMQEDEQQAIQIRNRHRRIFEEQHRLFHGEILQYFGDGTLSIFQSGIEAVECAIAIQRAAQFKDVIPLRVGLHIGDLVFDGTDIYGDSVNVASRIESMGVAGAVLISQKLNDELHNQAHIETHYLGEYSFKNVIEAIGVFAVKDEHLRLPIPSELKGKRQQLEKSIAVLPFVNRSTDPENEYFSDGMTEEIINALSKIEGLRVTSRSSSFYFKDKQLPIAEIGDALNVSTILEGNIRLSKNKLRVTAQLVDVQDDYQFWSERFDRPLDDVFEVQDELSLLIADRLREHLGHLEIDEQLVEAPDISVDLYKQYLKARYLVLKMNKADVQAGIQLLEEIIAEKADFPMAYVGLHQAYTVLATVGFLSAKEAFGKAQEHLNQVLKIEPNLAEVQLNLSWTSLLSEWNFEKTYYHLNKSLEARPTIDYYQSMTGTLAAEGKLEAALHYIDTGIQIDPFSAVNYHLKGFVVYLMEDYPQAISHFDKSLSLNPDFSAPILYKGSCLLLMDKAAAALDYFEHLPTDRPSLLNRVGGMTLAQAYLNRSQEAEKGIQQLEAALESESIERAVLLLILCHTALGNTDKAIQWIEKGIDYRLPMLIYLFVDPLLKELRPIPQFQQLTQQVLGERTDFTISKRKYKKTLFTPEELAQQKAQLEQLMTNQQPYLDPNLTLRALAEQMSLPPNYLSQLLNEGFEQNFSEYINAYRVHTFKAKVAEPANQHLTILALAYDSGFNSKTVFNTFFKKMEGMTPRAYWKKVS
jgi:TolB-like protein/AraC-like DNA-binding protein